VRIFAEVVQEGEAVHAGHVQIEQHGRWPRVSGVAQKGQPGVARHGDVQGAGVGGVLEREFGEQDVVLVVVDHQQFEDADASFLGTGLGAGRGGPGVRMVIGRADHVVTGC